MRTRWQRLILAWLVALGSMGLGIFSPGPALDGFQPRGALALDQTISTCNWATFNATLNAVQAAGGGTITFDCSGTITFAGLKTIRTDLTIVGNGVVFDGNKSRLFGVNPGARLALDNLTVQNGWMAIGNRGTLEVTAVTFDGNKPEDSGVGTAGGAIHNEGVLTVTASTFTGNEAFDGGAIFNLVGTVVITASTFTDNSADILGGAIFNSGSLDVTASTFTGNNARAGGAIFGRSGTVRITASTIVGNEARSEGGGISRYSGATIMATASIVALNTASTGPNCGRPVASGGYNLSDDDSCTLDAPGDIEDSTQIDLGPLQNNGGLTETMEPLDSSDAIDAADCALSTPEDQRGVSRPTFGTLCDIGAVEIPKSGPIIGPVELDPAPSAEGEAVELVVTLMNPNPHAVHTCEIDWSDGMVEPGTVVESAGVGACQGAHTYADDGTYAVAVAICDDGFNCAQSGATQIVNNLPPVIEEITTSDAGIGDEITVTVIASDPGVNDTLMYGFDCDRDGHFEIEPQPENSTVCPRDQTSLTLELVVRVSDGSDAVEQSVALSFTQSYCAKSSNGQLRLRPDGCGGNEQEIVLSADSPVIFCANPGNDQLRYRPQGCQGRWQTLIVPGDEPIETCEHIHAGLLRLLRTGSCGPHEHLHIIPAA